MNPRPQRPSRRQRPTAVGGASSSRVGLAAGGLALSITLISGSVSRPAPSAAQPPDGVDADASPALDLGWTGGGEVLAGSAVGLWLGPEVQLVDGDVIRWELPGGTVETTAGGSEDLPAVFAEFSGGPDEEVRVELVRGGQVIGTVEIAVPVVGVRSVSVGDDEVGTAEATSGVTADGSPASLDPDRFTTVPGLASSGGTLADAPAGPARPVTGIGGTEWAVAAAVPVADRELAAVGYLQDLVDAGLMTEAEALALLADPALLAELGLRLVGRDLGVSVGADGLLPDGSRASAEVTRVLSLVGVPVPGRSGSLLLTHAPGVLPRGRRFDRSEGERYALGLIFLDALIHLGLIDPADAAELANDRRFVADLGSALQDPDDPEGRLAISVVAGVAGSRIDRALQAGSRDRVTARQAIAAWLAAGDAAAIPRVLRDAGFVIDGRVTVLGRWSADRDIKGTDRNDVVIILGGTTNDSGVDLKKGNDLVVVFGGLDGDSELDLDRGHDTAVVFDYAGDDSDIEGNQGVDDIALIGAIGENMDLDLGDESDRVFVSGVVRDLFIDGDSGDDQAFVVGHASGLNFEGESGNDSLTVIGDLERSRVDGDKGDDRFTVHGSVIDSYLEFDRGDDTIDAYGIVEGSRLKTGRHDDEVRFEALFADGSLDLGRGDDRFEFTGQFLDSVLEGGRGDDIVTFRGELLASRIEAGKGDDQIFLDGLYDPDSFVGGGKGADVIDLRGQGVPGFVIDLGKNKRGDDVLRVRDEFRGSVDVSDPKRSFVYRGSTRVRNQDVVLLLGEGWEQIADPDGGLTLRRTDPESGAVLSDVQVIGDAEHLEKILAAVDPTTDPYGVFQNLDPEVRRRPLSIVISTIGTGLLVTSSFFTAGTTLAVALAGSAAAASITSSAIDGTDIGRILLNAGLTGLGIAGGAFSLKSLNHFGSIVRSVDAFANGDPLGGLLQAAGGGLGFASLEGALPADVVSRFNQASAGLRATVAGFDGDLIDIVSGLATIVGAASTDAQAIEVLSDIGIGIGGYKAIKALTQGDDPGAGLDGLLNTLGALVTDNIVTPAEREKARQELERQLELLEAQTEGGVSPLGQGGDDLPLGSFPFGEGAPTTFPIGEPPPEGSNPFGRSVDGLGATFAAYREGQITLEDALLATRMTLDEFRTFTFFTDPLAGGSGHTDQVFLPAPPPSPGGNSKPLAVPYAPPNANHSLDESLQAQEALVDLPSVFPEEGSDRVFTDANGNVVAVEVGGSIVDHELVDLGDGLTEVRVDGDSIAIADRAGVSTIDGSGFVTQTVAVTGILDERSLRFADAYYATQVFPEGGTGLVEERVSFEGPIWIDDDGNWVTSGGVPVSVQRASASGSSMFFSGRSLNPGHVQEIQQRTRIFLRDQPVGYGPGLTPEEAKRNLAEGDKLARQQLGKRRDALQLVIDQGRGNLQVPRTVLNYLNWLLQTGASHVNRPVHVGLTEGWVHPSNPLEFVTDENFRLLDAPGPGRSGFQTYLDPGEGYVPERTVLTEEQARQRARDQGYVEAWQADNGLGLSDAVGLVALVVDSVLTPWIPETGIAAGALNGGMKLLGLADDGIDIIELSSLYTPFLNGITEWDEGLITGEEVFGRLRNGIEAHAHSKLQSALVYNPAARGLRHLSTQLRQRGSVAGLRFGSGRQVLLDANAADALDRYIGEVEAIARPAGGSQSTQSTESNKKSSETEGTLAVPPTSPAVEVDSSLATELLKRVQQGWTLEQAAEAAKQAGYSYLSVELQRQLFDARTDYVQAAVDGTAAAVSSDLTTEFGVQVEVTSPADYGNQTTAALSSNQYQRPTVRVVVPVVVTQNGYSVERVLTFDARPGDVDRILDSIEVTPNVSLAKHHGQVLADNGLSINGLEARQTKADLAEASAAAGLPLTEWTLDAADRARELNESAHSGDFAVSLTVEFNGKTYKARLSNLTPAALNQEIAALKEKGFVIPDLPDDLVGSGAHPLVKVDSSGDVVARPLEEQPNQVPDNQKGTMHYFGIFNRLRKFGVSFNVTHLSPEHRVPRQILVSGLPVNLWFKTEEDADRATKYLETGVDLGPPVVVASPPSEPDKGSPGRLNFQHPTACDNCVNAAITFAENLRTGRPAMAVPIVTPTQLSEGYDDLWAYANRIYAQGQEARNWTPVEAPADWDQEVRAVAARDDTTRQILEHGGQTFFVVAHRGAEAGHVWLARVVERYSWRDGRNTRQVEFLDPSRIRGVGPAEFNGALYGHGPYVRYEFIPIDGPDTHPGSVFANKGNPPVNRDLGNVPEAPEGETLFPIESSGPAHPEDLFGSIPFIQGNQLHKSALEKALADAQRLNASNGTTVMLAYQDKGGNSYVVWVPRSAAQDALDLLGASTEIAGSADLIKAQNGLTDTVLLPESAFAPETDRQPNILDGIVPVQPAGDPIELVYGSDDLRALTAQQSPEELRPQILDRESFPKYYLDRKVVRVTIVGEAGLGQSRAVIQLLEKDPNTGQRVVTGTTVASAQGVPGLTDLEQLFELNPVLGVQYWHVPDDFNFETDNEKWLFRISVTGGGVSARVGLTAWSETDSKQGRVTANWELQNRWATTWTVLRDPGFSKADKLAALRDLALALPPSGLSGFFASIRNDGVTRKLTGLPPSTGEVRDRRNPQPTLEPSELELLIIGVQEARDEEELGDVLELYGIEPELVDEIIDPSTQRELSTNELTDDEPTDDGIDEGSEPEGPSGQDLDADPDPDT